MCPAARLLVNGDGSLFERGSMVCHCMLVETNEGLVLIDTGFGTADIADPRGRLGGEFLGITAPRLDLRETALHQVEALGFSRADVRHIIVTHLDLDHAGGLSDFPNAKVHLHALEEKAARERTTFLEKNRYKMAQFAHQPKWETYQQLGEKWFGFDAVQSLKGLPPEILLIPLHGHTRGHSAVAVKGADKWQLHCGDAYFFHGEVDPARPHCTFGLKLFQSAMAVDNHARRQNRDRLVELVRAHGGEIDVFSAHDPVEFARYSQSA